MKHLLVAGFLASLCSSSSWAAYVGCTPNASSLIVSSGIGSPQTYTCNPSAVAGNIAGDSINVLAVIVRVQINASTSAGAPNQLQGVLATVTNSMSLVNPGPVNCSFTSDFNGDGVGSNFAQATTPINCVDVAGPFQVTVTPSALGTMPQNATATVFYDTIPCTIPEPSTYALLGSALAITGVIQRRQRNQR